MKPASLFDLIEEQLKAERPPVTPETCPKHEWMNTITVWMGEDFERLTVTCERCGEVRGRA